MKRVNYLSEIHVLTKSDLNNISIKVFKQSLRGNKRDFINGLNFNLSNYGNDKYNLILVNMILSNKLIESTKFINTSDILTLKYLKPYDRFLYKYHLGYKALYRDRIKDIKGYQVDTKYIFDDQFNTLCNKRICERDYFIIPSKGFKDLTELRANIYKCAYCGKQYSKQEAEKIEFCTACRGSEHLDSEYYKLLKLKAISDKSGYKNIDIPSYVIGDIREQQSATNKRLILQNIENAKQRIVNKIKESEREITVLTYLLDNEYLNSLYDLYIYYNHTNTLSFKWKSEKITPDLKELILDNKSKIESDLNLKVEV